MTLPQDSGFKWTVASTLVLAIIFAMTTFGANAGNNPPLASPPGGTISPAFSNLEASTDIIAGQNVRVGNAIKPKTGTSLALDAEKINFTKDIEVAGGGIVGKVLQVLGSIKGKDGSPLVFDSDAEVSGKFNVKGGSGDGIFIDNEKISRPAGALKLDSAVNITGALNAPMGVSLGNTTVVDLKIFGANGLNVTKDVSVGGKLSAGSISPTAGDLAITGNVSASGNLTSSKHLSAASIGSFYFSSDKPKSVGKNGGTATFDSYCPDAKYQMISCSLQYFGPGGSPMPTPDIYNGKAHIGNSYIDRTSDPKGIHFCRGEVWNQYDSSFSFRPQVTCFDSSK